MKIIDKASKIGLGTVQFGIDYGISNTNGVTNEIEVSNILELAKSRGVDTIDTAFLYGDSQKKLGKNDLSSFKVVSKFSTTNEDEFNEQLTQTLNDLNLDKIYAFLSHNSSDVISNPKLWDLLNESKEKGVVSKIGFSLNTPEELELILKKGFFPDLIQIPYNYLDNRFEKQAEKLKLKGCEIHSRSTFLQGIFFRDVETLPSFYDEIKPIIKKIQQSFNVSESLISFVKSQNFVDKIILGVENSNQLEMNLKVGKKINELEKLGRPISREILMPMFWPK
jgi:aryl-alcohol dehydrogenase-like predicted oxidoreductase